MMDPSTGVEYPYILVPCVGGVIRVGVPHAACTAPRDLSRTTSIT
jgi:hypothetical protein